MPIVPDVLRLRPGDLSARLPAWEPRIDAGGFGIAIIVGTTAEWEASPVAAAPELAAAPLVTIGLVSDGPARNSATLLADCDLIVGHQDDAQRFVLALTEAGAPALVAAQVLRAGECGTIALESLAYSTLLAGEEFSAWRAAHARHTADDSGRERVSLRRGDGTWVLTLTRPARHNAFDAQMREELCDALDSIAAAPPLPVVLLGAGDSFCSGGDLDEFGTAASPVAAHLIRCGRSVARRLQRLSARFVAGVQGACIGAGVEFSSFAQTVIAAPDSTFLLPELWLGLNLGAGGSISIPRRIGRQRTLELLLTREPIDTDRAASWGLVDEVVESEELEARCVAAAEALA